MANIARRASEQAAKDISFAPEDVRVAGLGSATFGPNGINITSDSPGSAFIRSLGSASSAAALEGIPGVQRFGQNAQDVSQQLLGAVNFDPLSEAENRFGRLRAALDPYRQREDQARMARDLQTGRYGSTAAGQAEADIIGARQLQDLNALNQFYGEAQNAQQQAIAQGLQAGAAGTTAQQSNFQQALQAEQLGLQQAAAPVQLAGLGINLGAAETAALQGRAQALASHNQAVASNGSDGGFGSAIGGVIGGVGAGYLTGWNPAAMQTGATVGSNLGSFL